MVNGTFIKQKENGILDSKALWIREFNLCYMINFLFFSMLTEMFFRRETKKVI